MGESTNLSKGTLFRITKSTEDFFHWAYLSVSISLKVLQIVQAQLMIFFWIGTKILPYVHFTYFNIFSEDPSGSCTKICDVTLPRLLRVTESRFGHPSLLLTPPSPNNYQTYLDPVPPAIVNDDFSIAYFRFQVGRSISLG